jgi:hypothetical protein
VIVVTGQLVQRTGSLETTHCRVYRIENSRSVELHHPPAYYAIPRNPAPDFGLARCEHPAVGPRLLRDKCAFNNAIIGKNCNSIIGVSYPDSAVNGIQLEQDRIARAKLTDLGILEDECKVHSLFNTRK